MRRRDRRRARTCVGPRSLGRTIRRRGDRPDLADRLDPVLGAVRVDGRSDVFGRRSSVARAKQALALRRTSSAWRFSQTPRESALASAARQRVPPARKPHNALSVSHSTPLRLRPVADLARDRPDRRPLRTLRLAPHRGAVHQETTLGQVHPDHRIHRLVALSAAWRHDARLAPCDAVRGGRRPPHLIREASTTAKMRRRLTPHRQGSARAPPDTRRVAADMARRCCARPPPVLLSAPLEGWPSGRRRTPGKCVYGRPYRGFESLSLRHNYYKSMT